MMNMSKPSSRGPQAKPAAGLGGLAALAAALVIGTVGALLTGCRNRTPRQSRADTQRQQQPPDTPSLAGRKVLLVHSYHSGSPWVDAITRGVKMAMSQSGADLQLYYMDTKRRTDEAWKLQSGQAAQAVVADWQPEVVIAADDNAQQYFAKDFAGRAAPQFVFCGVNAQMEKYGYPAGNITGILERPHTEASLRFLEKLKPGARRIAIVTDDSPTSAGALEFINGPWKEFEIVSCETPSTFEQWQVAIRNCQGNADAIAIYMYHTVKPHPGAESMEPKWVMTWTVENSRIPIVGFFVFAVDDGALCGYMESGVEHGLRAGRMALELLAGKTAADLQIVTALEGQSMLNLNTARKLGIEVPQGLIDVTDVVIGK